MTGLAVVGFDCLGLDCLRFDSVAVAQAPEAAAESPSEPPGTAPAAEPEQAPAAPPAAKQATAPSPAAPPAPAPPPAAKPATAAETDIQTMPDAAGEAAATADGEATTTGTMRTTADPVAASLPPGLDVDPQTSVEPPEPPPEAMVASKLLYHLERIDVRGNHTRPGVITGFLPFSVGATFDPADPELNLARVSLLATGWFEDVRFTLERGVRRGAVVLIIEVEERNTLLFDRVAAGLSRVVTNTGTQRSPVRPYAGLGLRERNLLGLGIGISGAGVISVAPSSGQVLQYGLDFRYHDPALKSSDFDLRARVFHNHAREFFGRNPRVDAPPCPEPEDGEVETCDPDIEGRRAVVIYDRTGLGLGTGSHLNPQLHYSLGWLGERADVGSKPFAASTQRGRASTDVEPIDFRIEDDTSFVSSIELGLTYDTRDHPATPNTGDYLALRSRVATAFLGSDYDFVRVEADYRHHLVLPWEHQLSFGAFLGSVFGYAPFFYHFYAADLSDLLPSRQLELNLDHRRTHDLLGTAIREMDQEELAARVDFEYKLPIVRGGKGIRRLDAYGGAGLFLLARRGDLQLAVPGYGGLSRLPVDITFDIGVIAETDVGLFKLGFSTLIGFLPDLGQGGR